jgi:Uma2 family endonuclease
MGLMRYRPGVIDMSTVSTRLLSPQEYLDLERQAEFRSEYYRGEMFAMAGASWEHTAIKDNLAGETRNQLKGGPCRARTSDIRVKVNATGLYTYPDMVVVCGEPQFEDSAVDTLLNPRVIVEILSDSTEKYDRGAKFGHYRQVPSIQEYVLVAQDRPLVERFVRQPDNSWVLTAFGDMAQTFDFETIPVQVTMAEIYRDVKFPDAQGH